MIACIKRSVRMSAFRAFGLIFAGSFTAVVCRNIKLCAEITGVPMIYAIGFPFTIGIGMLAGGRNIIAGGNLGTAIGAPCIAGVAFFTAGSVFCITHLGVLMVGRINCTVFYLARRADRLVHTGSFAAGVGCFINNIAAADCLTLFPVARFIGCPNGSRIVSAFSDRLTFTDFSATSSAIGVPCVAFIQTSCFFLIFQISFADMVVVIIIARFKGFFALYTAYGAAFVINCLAAAGGSSFQIIRLYCFAVFVDCKIAVLFVANIANRFLYTGCCTADMIAEG